MTDTMPGNAGDQADEFDGAILEAAYSDSLDQSLFIHKDLVRVREAYPIGPPKAADSC